MEDETPPSEQDDLVSRAPTQADLVRLCGELNERGARYVVIGGLAIIHAGYLRTTNDVDLLIDTEPANEAKVLDALSAALADGAARELKVGEVAQYTVVRVNDEITVDLMHSASGIKYLEASGEIVFRELDGVQIPFASPRLLWLMKRKTHREKDQVDLIFLRQQFPEVAQD